MYENSTLKVENNDKRQKTKASTILRFYTSGSVYGKNEGKVRSSRRERGDELRGSCSRGAHLFFGER